MVEQTQKEVIWDNNMVGLLEKTGRYRILGGVTLGSIFHRTTAKKSKKPRKSKKKQNTMGNPLAKTAGYKVAEYEVDTKGNLLRNKDNELIVKQVKIVTKEEGLNIAKNFGFQNAYIETRFNDKKLPTGDIVKTVKSVYLFPYPKMQESFFQEGRAVVAYELNSQGRVAIPVKLLLKEEECSVKFWRLLQKDYEKKLSKKSSNKEQKKDREKMEALTAYLQTEYNEPFINPFAEISNNKEAVENQGKNTDI